MGTDWEIIGKYWTTLEIINKIWVDIGRILEKLLGFDFIIQLIVRDHLGLVQGLESVC